MKYIRTFENYEIIKEDFLVCAGGELKDFFDKIKDNIGDYELKNGVLKFMISGDEVTVDKYKKIAKSFGVKCEFQA